MTILLDIIEVLLFLVCVLFSVAYLTVAERKTLGYMQRRLGPNAVGQTKIQRLNKTIYPINEISRHCHTSLILNNNSNIDKTAIEELYKDRIQPVKN